MSINPVHYQSICCCFFCKSEDNEIKTPNKPKDAGCDPVDRKPELVKKRSYYWLQSWEKNDRQDRK